MAVQDIEMDSAEREAGSGKMKLVIFGVAGLLLLVVGIIAGPAVMSLIVATDTEETDSSTVAVEQQAPPIYQTLHPPLVVNLKDEAGDVHFMQVTMEVMSRNQSVVNAVRDNVAAIRNALILLYSSAIYEEVTTRDGKEQMLADGLAEIENVLVDTSGEGGVEALYFTALVIQ